MRQMAIFLLACTALSGTALVGGEKKSNPKSETDRAQVTKFLKQHVIGKTVATPKVTFKRDNDKVGGDYQDQTTFNNFIETEEGFSFDVTTVSKETGYDLDGGGKRVGPGRDFSGTSVYRYELCERASTKQLTGIARVLSRMVKAPSVEGTAVLLTGVKVAGGKLSWKETLPGYGDFAAARNKYKPQTFVATYAFAVVDGKLRTEYDFTMFDVDPDTLKRTPAKEKWPVFVAKEIDQK